MQRIYAVWDEKAEAYGSLICCATAGLAARAFSDACADSRSPMAQYPGDYKLVELGTFDPNSGAVVGHVQPVFITSASATLAQLRAKAAQLQPELPLPVPVQPEGCGMGK